VTIQKRFECFIGQSLGRRFLRTLPQDAPQPLCMERPHPVVIPAESRFGFICGESVHFGALGKAV